MFSVTNQFVAECDSHFALHFRCHSTGSTRIAIVSHRGHAENAHAKLWTYIAFYTKYWKRCISKHFRYRKGPGQLSPYIDWLRAGRSGDRMPVGERFFAHVQTAPGAHPTSCTMGTGSFPGVKRPRRGADHPPPSSAKVKMYRAIPLPPLGFRVYWGYLYLLPDTENGQHWCRGLHVRVTTE
jgi:hypothetical protein